MAIQFRASELNRHSPGSPELRDVEAVGAVAIRSQLSRRAVDGEIRTLGQEPVDYRDRLGPRDRAYRIDEHTAGPDGRCSRAHDPGLQLGELGDRVRVDAP